MKAVVPKKLVEKKEIPMAQPKTYQGSCHCGAVKFSFSCEPITQGCRCNCSICRRKGATMSEPYFPKNNFELLQGENQLTKYQFGDHDVNHYFCSICGISPFHDGTGNEGNYRVNLACVDDVDIESLTIRKIDGASF